MLKTHRVINRIHKQGRNTNIPYVDQTKSHVSRQTGVKTTTTIADKKIIKGNDVTVFGASISCKKHCDKGIKAKHTRSRYNPFQREVLFSTG